MFTLAVFTNIDKKNANNVVKRIIDFSHNKDIQILMPLQEARFLGYAQYGVEKITDYKVDMGLSIGGDGTLLGVCRRLYSKNIPICGINIGTFGFLTDIELSEIENKLEKIINGKYSIEERMVVSGYIKEKNKKETFLGNAINDIVITRDGVARMLHLSLSIDGMNIMNYKADGLIVSTATGSTAYSLSAGGPIINPILKVLLLTPVCPHTFNARPMVVDEKADISVKISSFDEDVIVSLDGQESHRISPESNIIIRKSTLPVKIVKFADKNFYQIVKTKLLHNS